MNRIPRARDRRRIRLTGSVALAGLLAGASLAAQAADCTINTTPITAQTAQCRRHPCGSLPRKARKKRSPRIKYSAT